MHLVSKSLIVCWLLMPWAVTATVAATSHPDDAAAVKHEYKLHAYKSMGQPDVITVDGVQQARRVDSALVDELNEAKAQVRGCAAVHYVVPGHSLKGI